MASEGVEKYSLIQFIFSSLIILKILQRAYSFSVGYSVLLQRYILAVLSH
jgi:hypothetical protein